MKIDLSHLQPGDDVIIVDRLYWRAGSPDNVLRPARVLKKGRKYITAAPLDQLRGVPIRHLANQYAILGGEEKSEYNGRGFLRTSELYEQEREHEALVSSLRKLLDYGSAFGRATTLAEVKAVWEAVPERFR